ncbi:hypothetical protein RirG_084100 [Rhizophagus irregularis DAOM 197198w]|uniref:Uncharacterized protein n=1 Tax=Rhizophagus irregularis (strain DAOM 197198w) TaxID=1432141 RepID=A0A015LE40_RHIIW|nr:hypothetical protein RirG_084100 [Rhizophagus irregularis DAOM 197198w]
MAAAVVMMQSHETGQTEVGDEMQKSQTVVAGLGVERAERRCVEKKRCAEMQEPQRQLRLRTGRAIRDED